MLYELPGATVVTPKSCAMLGRLANVVCNVAAAVSELKSMPPVPEKVKLEVCRSDCLGKRKTSEQVLPASEGGMSKLKMLETVELIWPLSEEAPAAWFGLAELMGMIRCGNSNGPEREAGHCFCAGALEGAAGAAGDGAEDAALAGA